MVLECIKNKKQSNIILFIFMAIFLAKGIFYAAYITPPSAGTAPDDIGHISYIQYVASEKKLPILFETSFENITTESHKSYYNFETINYKKFIVEDEQFDEKNGVNWIAQHPPLYYLLMSPIYLIAKLLTNKLYILIIILRLATIPFGIASIFVMSKIMDILKTKNIVRYCIFTSFVFSAPMQFYFSNITNDSLLIFICILTLYFLLKYTTEKHIKHFYLFVVCCALTVMTKYTGALVLIGYILYFLFKSIREDGIKKTARLCVQGGIIGGIIVAPVFLRNYILYGNPVKTFNNNTLLYEITFFQFIKDKGYFNELYSHLVTLIGWKYLITSTNLTKSLNAIILSGLSCFCLYKDNRKGRALFILFTGEISIFVLHHILNLELSVSVALISFLIISYYMLTLKELTLFKKEINGLFIFTIITMFLIFMSHHYKVCLHRGHTGGMHGRYYYIAVFPFLYLIFNILEEFKFKYTKYLPILMTSVLMSIEVQTIVRCLERW